MCRCYLEHDAFGLPPELHRRACDCNIRSRKICGAGGTGHGESRIVGRRSSPKRGAEDNDFVRHEVPHCRIRTIVRSRCCDFKRVEQLHVENRKNGAVRSRVGGLNRASNTALDARERGWSDVARSPKKCCRAPADPCRDSVPNLRCDLRRIGRREG